MSNKKIPIQDFLCMGKKLTSSQKKRLFSENVLKSECYVCKQPSDWNGEKLQLQIDHINGNHLDNSLKNLRAICPNCHSQTETFAGKNKGAIMHFHGNKGCTVAVNDGQNGGFVTFEGFIYGSLTRNKTKQPTK